MLVRALPPGSHRVGLGLLTARNSTRIWRMQVIVVHAGGGVVQGRCGVDHDGHYALLERDMPFPQLICGLNGLTRRAASWNIGLSCSPRGSVQFAEAHAGMPVFSETTSARYPTDVLPAKRVSPLHRSCIMTSELLSSQVRRQQDAMQGPVHSSHGALSFCVSREMLSIAGIGDDEASSKYV